MGWLSDRVAYLRAAISRPFPKIALLLFALVGVWDTFAAQFLSPELAREAPTVYTVFFAMSGWLSWYWWVIAVLTVLLIFAVEYGLKRGRNIVATKASDHGPMKMSARNVVGVRFTDCAKHKKIRINLERVCAKKKGAVLLMRLTSSRDGKFEKAENAYQLTGSGYPEMDMDRFGVPLLEPIRNQFGDELKGWVEIDNPSEIRPRRDFRFRCSGISERGDYVSSDAQGAYTGSANSITAIEFLFLPGEISAGEFELEPADG